MPSNLMRFQHRNLDNAAKVLGAGAWTQFWGKKEVNAANMNTNSVVNFVDGIKQRRLGGSGIVVSEIGLGTQRWVSEDSNAPNEKLCFEMMNRAILESGVNLIDTAEQYPIPSGPKNPEGLVETVIGAISTLILS